MSKTTYAIVHDAWQSCSSWRGVATRLGEAGHEVKLIDLPGHGTRAMTAKSTASIQVTPLFFPPLRT